MRFAYLLYQLTLRDLKARYKQTFLGMLWVFGRPLIELGVYALVFGAFLRAPTSGVPYPLFAFTGVVLWSYVAGGLSRGTRCISSHAGLVAHTPFPKLALPLATEGGALFDTLLAGVLLAGYIAYHDRALSLAALWLVPVGLLLVAIVTGRTPRPWCRSAIARCTRSTRWWPCSTPRAPRCSRVAPPIPRRSRIRSPWASGSS